MIEIYFKDLNKIKQHEIIMNLDENTVANIVPLALIDIEEIELSTPFTIDKSGNI